MSSSDSKASATTRRVRRDGWTPERQLRFLDTLERTRSVTRAARATGMSRESAYRLRARAGAALFAAAWDKALRSRPAGKHGLSLSGHRRAEDKGHKAGANSRVAKRLRRAILPANPRKVTKLTKLATPPIRSFEKELRELLHGPGRHQRSGGD